jgi:NADH:ubiquinone oxidoreductase subunit C
MVLALPNNLSFLSYLVTASYLENHENNSLAILSVYRQTTIEVATYFKLSSIFNMDSAVDAFVIDDIQNKFRFTLIYIIQSSTANTVLQIVTKLTDSSLACSVQSVFPAFN